MRIHDMFVERVDGMGFDKRSDLEDGILVVTACKEDFVKAS